jgi:23S rRNA (adenine2503-C2)-methyltransferase
MINLYELTPEQLADLLKSWGEPTFRAKQIWAWLYDKPVATFEAMTNIPNTLRAKLQAETCLGTLESMSEHISRDGTIKRLYACPTVS